MAAKNLSVMTANCHPRDQPAVADELVGHIIFGACKIESKFVWGWYGTNHILDTYGNGADCLGCFVF